MTNRMLLVLICIYIMMSSIIKEASAYSDGTDSISSLPDNQLKEELEKTQKEYEKIYTEYQEIKKKLDELNNKRKEDRLNSEITKQYQELIQIFNAKGKDELMPVENRLHHLQREWEKRINIPDDYKEYESIGKYLNEQYYKGVGTREEMVKKYEALAEKFPDSPLAVNALYDTAVLYTGGSIRENGAETYLPDKAREYYERIIAKHPDLLSEFFIWSRGNLADLCPTADQRLKSQIELYNWLKNVKPEQYKSTIEFMKKDYRYRNRSAEILEEQINALIKTTTDTLRKNMLANAKASSNPDENLTLVNKLLSSEESNKGDR